MKGKKILALPMGEDADAGPTVGDYLRITLKALIHEGEGFSGKRPLGNSDWDSQLAIALIKGVALKGAMDTYDEPDFDWADFNKVMFKAVDAMETK